MATLNRAAMAGASAPLSMCERCGASAPTRTVRFHQHIGLVLIFIHRRIGGRWCARCARDGFVQAFMVTLAFGWWGVISFFATLFFLPFDLVSHVLVQRSFADPRANSETSHTPMAALAGAGVLALGMCGGPYLLLLAFSQAMSGVLSGMAPPRATPTGFSSGVAPYVACDGDAVDSAPPFVAGHPLAVAYRRTGSDWSYDASLLADGWNADAWNADEPTLIVCLDAEEPTIVERCAVEGGEIHRTTYPRVVRIVELRTAREIARRTVEPPDPPAPCTAEDFVPAGEAAVVRSGARAQPLDVQAALALIAP